MSQVNRRVCTLTGNQQLSVMAAVQHPVGWCGSSNSQTWLLFSYLMYKPSFWWTTSLELPSNSSSNSLTFAWLEGLRRGIIERRSCVEQLTPRMTYAPSDFTPAFSTCMTHWIFRGRTWAPALSCIISSYQQWSDVIIPFQKGRKIP